MEEKIIQYQTIIIQFLEQQAAYRRNLPDLETQLIFDTKNHHYQLIRLGFRKDKFIYICPFHFDIKNGKVWIQQNQTDIEIGERLNALGIPKCDIVFGFITEDLRELSGYGVV